jgi:hypothetical protein
MFTDNFLTLSVFAQQVIGHEVQGNTCNSDQENELANEPTLNYIKAFILQSNYGFNKKLAEVDKK